MKSQRADTNLIWDQVDTKLRDQLGPWVKTQVQVQVRQPVLRPVWYRIVTLTFQNCHPDLVHCLPRKRIHAKV